MFVSLFSKHSIRATKNAHSFPVLFSVPSAILKQYILSLAFLQPETESRNYAESIALVKRRIHTLCWYFCTDVTFLCPVRCITKLSGILFCSPRVAIVARRLWGNKLSSEKVFWVRNGSSSLSMLSITANHERKMDLVDNQESTVFWWTS